MSSPQRIEQDGVRGWLHGSAKSAKAVLALTHGAGGDCETPLLKAVAEAFSGSGYVVLRYDLPFRQARPRGSPSSAQEKDREGIRKVVEVLRRSVHKAPVYLSGQSYGGRQSSMLAAQDAGICDGLLMLSYPLHPPGQPAKLRVEHFPDIRVPVLFVHGTRDQFGSTEEMEAARKKLGGRSAVRVVQGAGHGVPPNTAPSIVEWWTEFLADV